MPSLAGYGESADLVAPSSIRENANGAGKWPRLTLLKFSIIWSFLTKNS